MSVQAPSSESSSVTVSVDDGVATLRLGHPNEKIIVLSETRMHDLAAELTALRADSSLKGLIIAGASPFGFCAGADIAAIDMISDRDHGEALARQGQDVFQLLSGLPYPTVAAIQGACVGGGCELSLACTYRIISSARESKIGLPEIKLGIIPGFGGTQRLPRLVGIRKGMELILKARLLSPEEARRVNLVDLVVGNGTEPLPDLERMLLEKARDVLTGKLRISRPPLPMLEKILTFNSLGRKLVRGKVEAAVRADTKGLYPAPPAAIQSVFFGLDRGMEAGLEEEARHLGNLVTSPECKALVHIYRVSESASKLGRSLSQEVPQLDVTVIGAGVMGAGIAAAILGRELPVTLRDSSKEALDRGKTHVANSIRSRRGLGDKQKEQLLGRLCAAATGDSAGAAPPTGKKALVIEAVVEDLDVKKKVLSAHADNITADSVLATNTSSLSVSELASTLPGPERVVGIHFFNPAEKMPLVEIVRGPQTNERTLILSAAFVSYLGKYPIVVEDVPGFLVNRVLTPYLAEAGTLLSQGVPLKTIDRAAVQFGMPMGPFRLLDEVGLDVAAKVQTVITDAYGERMAGPPYAAKLVAEKRLGRKNSRGFYVYQDGKEQDDPSIVSLLGLPSRSEPWVLESDIPLRLIMPMVNEAVRCLDEGVAGAPGREAAGQIDLGTVMGTGFAPFRGGVLWYAELLGAREVAGLMNDLSKKYGKRFVPCDGITRRADVGGSFYEACA